jgi:hypothetical protein
MKSMQRTGAPWAQGTVVPKTLPIGGAMCHRAVPGERDLI